MSTPADQNAHRRRRTAPVPDPRLVPERAKRCVVQSLDVQGKLTRSAPGVERVGSRSHRRCRRACRRPAEFAHGRPRGSVRRRTRRRRTICCGDGSWRKERRLSGCPRMPPTSALEDAGIRTSRRRRRRRRVPAYLWSVEPSTGRGRHWRGWSGPQARGRARGCAVGVVAAVVGFGNLVGSEPAVVRLAGWARRWTGFGPRWSEGGQPDRVGCLGHTFVTPPGAGDMKPSGHGQTSSST